ncbi:hypothetical protein ABTY53_13180 [Streptomyces noursei]|uniref:hypothetical protein n=1 Tax=Streptomyces noursei TaxID=1971 RepID=UPI003324AAA0
MTTHSPAHIALSHSPTAGIVAIAHGERYPWAQTALKIAGFQPREDGAFRLPVSASETVRDVAGDLFRLARRHQAVVTVSSRGFLGDAAEQIAARLPGRWSAQLEIYSHPIWQHDLVALLWDDGELIRAVTEQQIPFAAVLTNHAGIELLLAERPGHPSDYLVAAFAPEGFDDNYDAAHAPRSLAVPGSSRLAASAIGEQFLPTYHRALHARCLADVAYGLASLRDEHEALQVVRESGRYSDAALLAPGSLPELERQFDDLARYKLRHYFFYAPTLLDQCRPAQTPWPQDAAALERLRTALDQCSAVLAQRATAVTPGTAVTADAKAGRGPQLLPVVDALLADGDVLLRQARAAAPPPPHTKSGPEHDVPALPPARPAPAGATPAGATPPRR